MSDIPSLGAIRALKTGDNRMWSPLDCLRDAIKDIEQGKKCDKLLILRVAVDDDKFDVAYHAANIRASEILATLECAKMQVLVDMGYHE